MVRTKNSELKRIQSARKTKQAKRIEKRNMKKDKEAAQPGLPERMMQDGKRGKKPKCGWVRR